MASSSIQPFGHNRHGPKTGGHAPFRGELGPHLTQRLLGRGLPPYQVASRFIQTFGHNRHWPKIGGLCPFLGRGELGPNVTECRLGWGLPPYQVASWSIEPFGHNRYGPKIRGLCPFGGGVAGSPSNTVWPGPWPTCLPSFILIHPFDHNTPTSRTGQTDPLANGLIA